MSEYMTQAERKEAIGDIYRNLLKREPDVSGLDNYMYSDMDIEEIEHSIKESLEYAQISRKEEFKEEIESLGTAELLMMGATPETPKHITALQNSGVQAVLCLDKKVTYPIEWCDSFLHVPISIDSAIDKDKLTACIDFIYKNVLKENKKLFVHSKGGVERAPMILALFLFIEKRIPFRNALQVIISRRNTVNPKRCLVNADLLQHAIELREKFNVPNPESLICSNTDILKPVQSVKAKATSGKIGLNVVRVSSNMFIGSSFSKEILSFLNKQGVKTIIDMNEKRSLLDSSTGSWFAHIHVPAHNDQLKMIMPVLIRSARKYMLKSPVYIMCDDISPVMMLLENYVRNMDKDDVLGDVSVDSVRKAILGIENKE